MGSITEKQMLKELYHMYQLNWMTTHGYSLDDIMKSMDTLNHDDNIVDTVDGMKANIPDIFKEWQDEYGFNGSLWVCFDEFCQTEALDQAYICGLINQNQDSDHRFLLRQAYWDWLESAGYIAS